MGVGRSLITYDFKCDLCGKPNRVYGRRGRQKHRFCNVECYKRFHAEQRSSRESYKYLCLFTFNVYDYPEHFDLDLIKQYGWYSASNRGGNLNGVSRDHLISIADGFKFGIDPALIAHPANCRLVRHTENQRKNAKSLITIDQLQERIAQFTSRYANDSASCLQNSCMSVQIRLSTPIDQVTMT